MDAVGWDYFEDQIATLVLVEKLALPKAIGMICMNHPSYKADVLLLAAISFATHLDNILGFVEDNTLVSSHHRYQTIAALAADVALLSPTERTCKDLRNFWSKTSSAVFL